MPLRAENESTAFKSKLFKKDYFEKLHLAPLLVVWTHFLQYVFKFPSIDDIEMWCNQH